MHVLGKIHQSPTLFQTSLSKFIPMSVCTDSEYILLGCRVLPPKEAWSVLWSSRKAKLYVHLCEITVTHPQYTAESKFLIPQTMGIWSTSTECFGHLVCMELVILIYFLSWKPPSNVCLPLKLGERQCGTLRREAKCCIMFPLSVGCPFMYFLKFLTRWCMLRWIAISYTQKCLFSFL